MEEVATSHNLHFSVFTPTRTSHVCQPPVPILLLHGYLGCGSDFRPLAGLLTEQGHTVLVPDLPLHGSSHKIPVVENPAAASSLISCAAASLLSSRGLPPTIAIVGYSLGGRLGLEVAAKPGTLAPVALALISSAPPPATDAEVAAARTRSTELANVVRTLREPRLFASWLQNKWYAAAMWGGLRDSPEFSNLVRARVEAVFGAGVGCESASLARLDALANAACRLCVSRMTRNISLPQTMAVLYIYGVRDEKYARIARQFSRVAAHVEVSCVEEAGHNVLFQKFDDVVASLRRFVSPTALNAFSTRLSFEDIRILPYQIPLRKSMSVGGINVLSRTGFLLALRSTPGGFVGVGDVAPLPGLHNITRIECLEELFSMVRRQAEASPGEEISLSTSLADLSPSDVDAGSPSLSAPTKCALYSALVQSIAAANGSSSTELVAALSGQYGCIPASVTYNSVTPRPAGSVEERESSPFVEPKVSANDRGVDRVYKLKVGFSKSVQDDIHAVKSLAAALKASGALLRIDANQSWTQDEFIAFCDGTKKYWDLLEYVEEPFKVALASEFVGFCADFYGPAAPSARPRIGLDESLAQFSLVDACAAIAAPGVAAAVLKPAVHGDLKEVLQLAKHARCHNVKVVLSSVFECGVGLAWDTLLAAACGGSSNVAHGVGTFAALAGDVIAPSFEDMCVDQQQCAIRVGAAEKLLETAAAFALKHGVDVRKTDLEMCKRLCS